MNPNDPQGAAVPPKPEERAEEALSEALNDVGASSASEEEGVVILDETLKEGAAQEAEAAQLAEQRRAEEEQKRQVEAEDVVEASSALKDAPVLEQASERSQARVLVLTKDDSLLQEGSLAQKRILELSEMFAEIHVIILITQMRAFKANQRLAENVWVYPVTSAFWWKTCFNAYRTANEQLNFIQGFRADIIIAEDPFESGITAYYLADKFDRPLQVHVFDDYFYPEFIEQEPYNNIRLWIARFVLGRADCVRTRSAFLRDRIVGKYSDLAEFTEVLPVYHNLEAWRSATPTVNLHERYPQFKFILLHVSAMEESSHTDRVITGSARTLFQYGTVGLVIVGDGPLRNDLEKQVEELGLLGKVVFEPATDDPISHMKSSELLVHLSENQEEEVTIIQAAAVGLPMVLGSVGLSSELFVDGESAYICPNDSPPCVSQKISNFMSDNTKRVNFSRNAEAIIFERIEQDYHAYLSAYRESIERCVMVQS